MARRHNKYEDIAPDEIFLDSSNLPEFDKHQFEGRIEKPISKRTIYVTGGFFALIGLVFLLRLGYIEIMRGNFYEHISENNSLHNSLLFSERGVISDRNGTLLAWNKEDPSQTEYSLRAYDSTPGISGLLGYVKYPKKDKNGFYYNTEYSGADGVEKYYDQSLTGTDGLKIAETDALGNILSESTIQPPTPGKNLTLSIDETLQTSMYDAIKQTATQVGYQGGAGVIMDINTGEVVTSVSYPEYDSGVMTSGQDVATINSYINNKGNAFLDRVTSGLYAPGSILKPFLALAALAEHIISPDKQIESTGQIEVPNPYQPGQVTVFKDWRVNGWTDMKQAIAVSSDVYFYYIGGGFGSQIGLGISSIDKYVKMFGFGTAIPNSFFSGKDGNIPSPEWKEANFDGDPWRIGDTYHTTIGQYGFQVTPIQAVRAVAALANDGTLLTPTLLLNDKDALAQAKHVAITDKADYETIKEGMRMTVTEGTGQAVSVPYVQIAAKTGTAQVGVNNEFINSWIVGFFPYDHPKYAFVLLMDRGPYTTTVGAPPTMRLFLDMVEQKLGDKAAQYFQ